MKKRRKIEGFLLGALAAAQLAAVPVSAADGETEGQWEDFAPEGTVKVEDTYRPILRTDIMYSAYIKLENDSGKAGIYGETLAIRDADEVGLDLYLDRYTGNGYMSYTYWKTVEYNTSMNIKSYTVSVLPGYYYRLHGYHYVDDSTAFDNGETITQGIKIP